jgi:hypothetical protein
VPLGLINPEHLISALRWLDSTTDNQHPDSGHLPDETPTKAGHEVATSRGDPHGGNASGDSAGTRR